MCSWKFQNDWSCEAHCLFWKLKKKKIIIKKSSYSDSDAHWHFDIASWGECRIISNTNSDSQAFSVCQVWQRWIKVWSGMVNPEPVREDYGGKGIEEPMMCLLLLMVHLGPPLALLAVTENIVDLPQQHGAACHCQNSEYWHGFMFNYPDSLRHCQNSEYWHSFMLNCPDSFVSLLEKWILTPLMFISPDSLCHCQKSEYWHCFMLNCPDSLCHYISEYWHSFKFNSPYSFFSSTSVVLLLFLHF